MNNQVSEEYILDLFRQHDAIWVHDGNPENPHAELSSGLCSNGFFECQAVLEIPQISRVLATQVLQKINKLNLDIDWIVSSAYVAITFGYEVARQIDANFGFVEKDCSDPSGKRMLWRRRTIPANSNVLQIEELITTLSTTLEVRRAINEGNREPVNFLPYVGTLVHRPAIIPISYGDIKVISLIEKQVWAVKPEECPLCIAGSKCYRPKTHWSELTKK